MKCCLLALLLLATADLSLYAQETFVLKPGESFKEVLTFNQIYSYPKFIDGTVYFRDGKTANGKFNYNAVTGEIQFLDGRNDTLSLDNEVTIRQLIISKDTFLFNKAYIRMISSNSSAKLGERIYYKDFVQKPGAYGVSTSATATNTVDLLVNRRTLQVDHDHEITLVKRIDFVFAGANNEFFIADRRSVSKAFPKYMKQIDKYLESNPVDFKKLEDLQRLCLFIGSLN
jgi:hypothetical protein